MTTVFIILLIVICLSKGLILLVNKYAPEEVIVRKQVVTSQVTGRSLNYQETAAIVSAISVVTGGQGKVVKIEKI